MLNRELHNTLSNWTEELAESLSKSSSVFLALFSTEKELLYANSNFKQLIKDNNPTESLLNPSFDTILSLNAEESPLFSGYITVGNSHGLNNSILADVFRKGKQILIIGGIDAQQLIRQNEIMLNLNREISDLQRELIKEKRELENANEELTATNEELDRVNTSKDRFLSILAHDLKAPFNSILGFLYVLSENLRSYDVDKTEEYIKLVYNSSKNVYDLLGDLLTYTRAQSSGFPFEPEIIDLKGLIDEIADITEAGRNAKAITFYNEVNAKTEVFADIFMLKTILRNLISNAIKFTNQNGIIKVSSIKQGVFESITVSDNGVGMDTKTLSELFDTSKKFTSEGTAGEQGTGLGLLLCKEFTERHGGQISAKSELQKGSQFTIIIPSKK
ncbi:sensor histidine kinase [Natronoflexus pectinivorans]|uniref:histidine kinase n=1 Tax=Natronoflexus pectinivorans TaxID=682526 RepID=A0A4R2GP49_9BACT|nr:HAMP domain-containing sensor histidine kinase [Natronoflexus pectinivorans]TCO11052.1 signal transduction histidine kinase [Natronoflexus pectinivorans]